MDVSIPKIIMQTWKDDNIPFKWLKGPESIKRLMSDWKYVLMTHDDMDKFVKKYFPDFYSTYRNFPYDIQRCDAFRYMWLYEKGGIYIDLDFELKESLANLINKYDDGSADTYFALSGNNNRWYTNSFLASKPGCFIWLEILRNIGRGKPWWAIGKHFEVMYSAGPAMLTNVLSRTIHKFYTISSIDITPCNICEIPCDKEGTFVKQLEGGAWYGWDSVFYNFLFCRFKYILAIIILLVILYWFLRIKKVHSYPIEQL